MDPYPITDGGAELEGWGRTGMAARQTERTAAFEDAGADNQDGWPSDPENGSAPPIVYEDYNVANLGVALLVAACMWIVIALTIQFIYG